MVSVISTKNNLNAHARVVSIPESFDKKELFNDLFDLNVYAENSTLALSEIETAITNACCFYNVSNFNIKRI